MPSEWDKLRSWNATQWAAFEELICQLARYEHSPSIGEFVRKGTPDAGVECFWKFTSGEEHGWQAKFFKSQPSSSQWVQIDSSVKRALEKHPELQQYTICMAFDPPHSGCKDTTSFGDKWKARVAKWESWATEKGMCVKFCRWGTSEIFERLSRDEHRGRHFFWFNEELFTSTWFERRLNEVIAAVGPRYSPKLNVRLPLSDLFEGLSRSPVFFKRFQEVYGDIGKERAKGFLTSIEKFAPQKAECFYEQLEQLVQTAKNYDKTGIDPIDWSLMKGQTREALKCISEIVCLLREKFYDSESCETGENTQKVSKEVHLDYTLHALWRIEEKLKDFEDFVNSDVVQLTSQPALLLVGAAGTGKTHMFSDAAKQHVQTGAPAILLLGIEFTKEEPWNQIRQMLDLTCTTQTFLGALETAAQSAGRRAIIFIDALNEVEDASKWQTWLPSMLKCLERHPWIAIAVSVRTSFENQIIPDHLVPDEFLRCTHQGFDGREYEAAKEFFDFYKLQMPPTPLLTPEYRNPLFLRCLCEGLKNRNVPTIPTGIHGISSVFDFFLDSVDEKLAKPEFLDYDPESRLVLQAIRQLATRMSQSTGHTISRTEAIEICEKIYPHDGFNKSLFRHLLSENVLFETNSYHDTGNHGAKVVTFSYQRLADHLIMQELLGEHVNSTIPAEAFKCEPLGSYFKDEMSCRRNSGLVEALAIQGPETLKQEIFDLIPELKESFPVCEAFIESLIWRAPSTIQADKCIQYIKAHITPQADLNRKFLNAILTIAPYPQHPFNADFLHGNLMKLEMPERDARWSIPVFHEYGENGAVDRLIDWVWSDTDKTSISDESVRLLGTALVWFLTTSHRFLRDRTTKALVSLFGDRIHVLCQVISNFVKVNDLYVLERLYSVAYGCALRSCDSNAKTSLSQLIYDLVFRDGNPPCHILLRDYARGVVEVALRDGLNLVGVEPHRIRPPYKSEWPLQIPSEEDVQEYGKLREEMCDEPRTFRLIYNSVMEDGDFARYIIGNQIPWSKRRLGENHAPSRKERFDAFVASLTDHQKSVWHSYIEIREGPRFGSLEDTGFGDVSEESLQHDFDSTVKVSQVECRFRRTLGKKKKRVFLELVLPYLDAPRAERDELAFPSRIAQLWILKRVSELGWTEERFSRFDRDAIAYFNRGAAKPERIGKKYQWIAYHEFLAHLADNLEFRDDYWSEEPGVYDGPWQLWLRDIDPSSLLKTTCQEQSPNGWWTPVGFESCTDEPDAIQWRRSVDLLPEIGKLPIVRDPATGQEWFVLECLYNWEEPIPPETDKYSISQRYIWYILKSYLVKTDDEDRFCDWANAQCFTERSMPESRARRQVFLGEFFWAPSFEYFNRDYGAGKGWTKGDWLSLPCNVLVTSDECFQGGDYDCSFEDATSVYLPAKWIADRMQLSWRGVECRYFDQTGHLIAQDPSIKTAGPKAFLMDKDFTTTFLNNEGYRLVWTLIGEKDIRSSWDRDEDKSGWMVLNGCMRMRDGQISGQATAFWQTLESDLMKIEVIEIR